MSINVYLEDGKVEHLTGFTEQTRKDGSTEYRLPGLHLWRDDGRWHVLLHDPDDRIPAVVAEIVEEISYRGYIPCHPPREAGIYRHESAEADVEQDMLGNRGAMKVRILAKTMEDLRELLRLIKTGSIRPEQSYEGPQGGPSRAELEAEIGRLQRSEQARSHTADRLETVRTGLGKLHVELGRNWCWPRRFKEMAMKEILRLIRL